jgi:hypothetical protein
MTNFPGSPRLTKGAIVGMDPFNPIASVIVFQYNPNTLTRSLQTYGSAATAAAAGPSHEALGHSGAPVETITLDVEIDATDQLERGDPVTTLMGIYPQLSALEMLLYPKSALVIANAALMAAGTMAIVPPMAPLTLFIWGIKRVLPVRLTSFSITEQAHDTRLNPIQAKVTLGLRVLSYNDLPLSHPGHYIFLAHQVLKEVMATVGSIGNISGAVSDSVAVL